MLVQRANQLTPIPVEWLWPNYLARDSLAIIDGDPGQGKSLVTLDLAARQSAGRPWPNGALSTGPASVLLLCAEDVDTVIVERLKRLDADLSRIYLWPRQLDGSLPCLPSEIARVEQEICETEAKLLIIDPIMAFWDRNVDVHTDVAARRALRPLADLAERRRCAILLVRHLNKSGGGNALYRGGGSIAFVASCRLAWIVGRDPKCNQRLVLAQTKNNYASRQPSLAYTLPKDGPRVQWEGESMWSADELASRRARPSRERAREFLRTFLAAGPRTVNDVYAAGLELGASRRTIRRAKDDLGIRCQAVLYGSNRTDYWLMENQNLPTTDSDQCKVNELLDDVSRQYPRRPMLDAE